MPDTDDSPFASRRAVLRSAASTGGCILGGGALAASAGVALADHRDVLASSEHVALRYDQAELERWQPLLKYPDDTEVWPEVLYAWTVSSPEWTHDYHLYVAYYPTQRGHIPTGIAPASDSHRWDREPVVIKTHPDYQEVRGAAYTAWHWQIASTNAPHTLDDPDGGEHVTLETHPPHNHYSMLEENAGAKRPVEPLGTTGGDPFGTESQRTRFEEFLYTEEGEPTDFHRALEPGMWQIPRKAFHRPTFWREGEEAWARRVWRLQLSLARLGVSSPDIVGGAASSELV